MKSYQHLNLEQKMTKIRRMIPTVIKKFHSDDVGYDFSKLDDIYELMTPALNKYNVNFDPVAERPTQVNESGNPTYLTMDKDGYWRYEADLDLCWTNADRPEEQKLITVHAIGTHEIPDKAKGAAWTYALKYYLRNKFSVRQGNDVDDPDMSVHGLPEGEQVPSKETGRNDGSSEQKRTDGKPKQEPEKQASAKENASEEKTNHVKMEKKKPEKNVKEAAEKKADVRAASKLDTNTAERKDVTEKSEAEPAAVLDGFQTVSEEDEIPFDEFEEDESLMDALNEEITGTGGEADSGFEAAREVKCTFGIFNGKTLGTILDSGTKGMETLRWLVNSYKGSDRKMVDAARILLEGENNSDKMAA